MGQQPSTPTDLSRTPLVIGSGFSRTGTVSLSLALGKLLNGPVYHSGTSVLRGDEANIKRWISIQHSTASNQEIEKVLEDAMRGYVAMTDCPAILFTEELVRLYPDAVVICSTREKESWVRSFKGLQKTALPWWLDVLFLPVPTLRWFGEFREAMRERMEKVYQIPAEELESQVENVLSAHETYIRRVVPPEKLHFVDVKDGWGPLCKILDCPVPDEPFPFANDAQAIEEFFRGVVKNALGIWARYLGATVLFGVGTWMTWSRWER